jgi:hypothetical protein
LSREDRTDEPAAAEPAAIAAAPSSRSRRSFRVAKSNNPRQIKTVLVAWRSRRATTIRLVAPFVFLLLALVVRLSLEANSREVARQRSAPSVSALDVRAIPDCTQDLYYLERPGRTPCVTFVYSPNDDPLVEVRAWWFGDELIG